MKIIKQWPGNKNILPDQLSSEQKELRKCMVTPTGEIQICKKCNKAQDVTEFWLKNRGHYKKRDSTCRDCRMKAAGVVEIGKQRFAFKIFDKGFRRCSVCKDIKPLSDYSKSKKEYGGYSNNCYKCTTQLLFKWQRIQNDNIGIPYIKAYGKSNYGLKRFSKKTVLRLKKEIEKKRKPKYFLDNKSFVTLSEFARYVEEKYGILRSTVEKRKSAGASDVECVISENVYRSTGQSKGKIKITDTITGEVFLFDSAKKARKMFNDGLLTEGIKTGKPVGGKRSRYPNPCIIVRLKK